MFLRILELLTILSVVVVGITQVVIPLWQGRKIFPAVRKKILREKIVDAREGLEDAKTESEILALQRRAGMVRDTDSLEGNK